MRRRFGWLLALLVAILAWPTPAAAHESKPAVLVLEEADPGVFELRWSPPGGASTGSVVPRFPEHCEVSPTAIECGEQGMAGEIYFEGLRAYGAEVIVQVSWADGTSETKMLRGGADRVRFGEATGSWGAKAQLAWAYTRLGIEHILAGIDHLLFVIGLLLVVGYEKRLLWTITAFTLAHSLTLALTVLGLVSAPPNTVEAIIALSILLVAAESLHKEETLTRRFPWAVSFGFGLLHGFGFAGALREIGLPKEELPLSLACFNIGVELGQLAVVLVVWGLVRALRPLHDRLEWTRKACAYAMGGLAAYWTIERTLSVFA